LSDGKRSMMTIDFTLARQVLFDRAARNLGSI
jgi:hypothetical protein